MERVTISDYKIETSIDLSKQKSVEDFNLSKKELEKELETTRVQLGELQDRLYAHGKYAVLVCLQGMDTSGKDSLIREVFKDFNARGVVVHSFKVPTELELNHDYLWRHYIALPARGKFAVFNRTHYENVLVTRVHPNYILGENLPSIHTIEDVSSEFWDSRFEQINAFEKSIAENGTLIFKFFLNLSKEEQKNRLLRR
ncbi:MAG: polyphosphate kinase 2 (PPK2 family), partial [Salibacteraceae bacterium]